MAEDLQDSPVTMEAWASVAAVFDPRELKTMVLRATGGRIAPKLVGPVGMFSIIWLACHRLGAEDGTFSRRCLLGDRRRPAGLVRCCEGQGRQAAAHQFARAPDQAHGRRLRARQQR